MDDAYYVALAGGQAAWRSLDVLANNLANVDTHGFKADRVAFQVVLPERSKGVDPRSDAGTFAERYVVTSDPSFDMGGGGLQATGNPLDLALRGRGFVTLEGDGEGQEVYTRDGGFAVDPEGYLVHRTGRRLVGEDGLPIQPGKGPLSVDAQGDLEREGAAVGKLKLVEVGDARLLSKLGSNLWTVSDPASVEVATAPGVEQGTLEGSNVEPAVALVDLVKVTRAYQAQQKVMDTLSELDSMRNNRLARFGSE